MAYKKSNPNGQATMANSEPVVIASDQSAVPVSASNLDIRDLTFAADKVDASGTVLGAGTNNIGDVDVASLPNGLLDSFGHIITAEINNDIDVQFYRATSDSDLSNIITETETSGGTCSRSDGMATFAATTTSGSRAKGVSLNPIVYTAGAEVYAIFTAAFPTATGGTGSYRRIGLYNDLSDGLFIGYETTGTFSVSIVKGGSQTTTLKANFSNDTLVGGTGSKFTRAGTPEAIDLTKLNVFRIRFGWVGSAPLKFEVLSPDGEWVLFHTILQPNLAVIPSLNTADLSFTCDVTAGTSGNAQTILSNCWGAGTTQKLRKLSDTLTTNTLAGLTRSVITGYSTAGGGAFVNVKVAPSGAMTVDASGTVLGAGTNNIGDVDVVSSALPTGAATLAEQQTQTASLSVLDDWDNAASDGASVSGDVAHDSADAGEPIKIGGKAVSAEPTAVTANDRTNAIFDLAGRQILAPYTNPENIVSGAITTAMTGTTSTSLVAAPGSGLRNYITTIIVSNSHATVGTNILIQDGNAGTTIMTIPAGPIYGGAVINLPVPLRQPTTNTALYAQNETTGASVKVSAVGFKSAL